MYIQCDMYIQVDSTGTTGGRRLRQEPLYTAQTQRQSQHSLFKQNSCGHTYILELCLYNLPVQSQAVYLQMAPTFRMYAVVLSVGRRRNIKHPIHGDRSVGVV